ncbi:VWA domain-containing protein [Acholeplasma equirhinis]|uniref:VWA domain-containing protein n=1 Tax=Acholeplasma equirhinis TaxID=555393 RepID=UPI00197AFFCC|nr:VWA domain-containing protein [Acholeplasma equirhinis]MBN3489893.1 VWA domain-containing protein [Acholeplasma equirhinis]
MSNINILFKEPLYLLLFIPALLLMLWPYFRLPKQHRRTRNRIISMVLHTIVLSLAIFTLSGMTYEIENVEIKNDVIILVDSSKSNESSIGRMNNFIQDIIEEMPDGYRVGIMEFANGNIYKAPISNNKFSVYDTYINSNQKPNVTGTDIAQALSYAHQSLENPSSGRIILMSDGRETDGRALIASSGIGNTGTRIDVVYFGSPMSDEEVQINEVKVPDFVSIGADISITVTVQSASSKPAVIKLYDNGLPIGEVGGNPVSLSGGTDTFIFDYAFSVARLHEIKVVVETDEDGILENNTYYNYVYIEGSSNKVLIIDGTGVEAINLNQLLENDYEVEVMMINDITPGNYSFINMYDQIILMNVSNADMPENFDLALKNYVEVIGGGLLTTGGSKAYQEDDMKDSVYESLLPVYANTNAKPLAIMLIIDASTSMTNGGSQKLNLAKQGAMEVVNALTDQDMVGVIMFNTIATVMIGPTPVAQKAQIFQAINNIQSSLGTRYAEGIQYAKNQLDNFPGNANFNKHIIFLTDGEPQDTGYMAVIAQLGPISLSSIAIGYGNGISRDVVQNMVRVVEGRGAFYDVGNEADLPAIMQQEALSVSSGYLNDDPFIPTIDVRTAALGDLVNLPELGGYYGTRLKDGAIQVLNKDSDPIYAEWTYGNGRVGSFMSDLNGDWSTNFFTDVRGNIFIRNTIDHLMPDIPMNDFDMTVQFTRQNFQSQMRVVNVTSEPDVRIYVSINNPQGVETSFELSKQSNALYGGLFKTEVPGIYEVTLTKQNNAGQVISTVTTYTAFSYSNEFNGFYDDIEMFDKMGEIARNGRGQILFNADNMFSLESQTQTKLEDPTLPFMITALILFLLDIIVRKFKIKFPHEIWQSIKDKKGSNSI